MVRGLGATTLLAAGSGLAGLLLAAVTPSAVANVIGIDLGVDFMKVGAVLPRDLELYRALQFESATENGCRTSAEEDRYFRSFG